MARKATNQVTTIAVGISRNTGHLIGLANMIGMSPAGQTRPYRDTVAHVRSALNCGSQRWEDRL